MNYKVIMSDDAQADYDEYIDYILYDCNAPMTAAEHYAGIKDTIMDLSKNPYQYAVRTNISLLQYGLNIRRVNFKKMAIIYTIHGNTIYVHRILAGSLITELN